MHKYTNLVDVRGAELRLAGAEFREIALVFGVAARHSRRLGPARLEVAALPRPARRVRPQPARGGVAAGIVAMFAQPANNYWEWSREDTWHNFFREKAKYYRIPCT
jgi:hypothetical protein